MKPGLKRKLLNILPELLFFLAAAAPLAAQNRTEPPLSYTGEELPVLSIDKNSLDVLLLGDWGSDTNYLKQVAAGVIATQRRAPFDFGLMLGDNFYPHGITSVTDKRWESVFSENFPDADLPFDFYVVLGNHDYHGNAVAEFEYREPVYNRWTCVSIGYVLHVRLADWTNVEFFLVDSEVLAKQDAKADALAAWAGSRMRRSRADYRILVAHRPLFSSGVHGDIRYMQLYFLDEFREGVLDADIAGHDHDLELQARSLDGNGQSDEYIIISGSGANIRPIKAGPHSLFAAGVRGFARLVINKKGMTVVFYDADGNILYP